MKKKALVIVVHPDDDAVGAGFLLSALTEKYEVHLITLAVVPFFSRYSQKEFTTSDLILYQKEAINYYSDSNENSIKTSNHIVIGDSLDKRSRFDITGAIDDALSCINPDIVFIPCSATHHDHEIGWKSCRAALRPGNHSKSVKAVYEYEYPFSLFPSTEDGFIYVELTPSQIDRGINAIEYYQRKGMYGNPKSMFSSEGLLSMAKMRGLEANVDYAIKLKLVKAAFTDIDHLTIGGDNGN